MTVPDPDIQAINPRAEAFRLLYERSGVLTDTHWLGVAVPRCPLDLWIYQEIAFHTRPDVVIVTGAGAEGVAFYMQSVLRLLGAGRAIAAEGPSSAQGQIEPGERVMAIAGPAAGADLAAHGALVSDGCYLIAENAAPEAIQGFLSSGAPFAVDKEREKFLVTFNPNGYLRRTGVAGTGPPPDPRAASGAEADPGAVEEFHRIFYGLEQTWRHNEWLGPRALKCPLDMWMYQELVHRIEPDLIVESGTGPGGSAHFLAGVCDLIGKGRIVTVDVSKAYKQRREHPRIDYIHDSSISDRTLKAVSEVASRCERVMVLLDSDHSRNHVLAELHAYSPLVTPGSYLVIEDTNLNGHPVAPTFGPGPKEAVEAFLAQDSGFEVDRSCEKFLLTFNPGGYLRRT